MSLNLDQYVGLYMSIFAYACECIRILAHITQLSAN